MPRKAGRVELGRAHGGDRPVSALAGGHHHQCGPQRAVGNGVALLQQLQHGVGGLIGRHRRNRLVQVRIELVALGRRDFRAGCARRRRPAASGSLPRLRAECPRSVRAGPARLPGCPDRNQALGERLDAELAGLGHVFLGAAAHVLGFRAHAQQLVMLFIDGGLGGVQLGAARSARPAGRPGRRGRVGGGAVLGRLVCGLVGCRHGESSKRMAFADMNGANTLFQARDSEIFPGGGTFAKNRGRPTFSCAAGRARPDRWLESCPSAPGRPGPHPFPARDGRRWGRWRERSRPAPRPAHARPDPRPPG